MQISSHTLPPQVSVLGVSVSVACLRHMNGSVTNLQSRKDDNETQPSIDVKALCVISAIETPVINKPWPSQKKNYKMAAVS